MLIQNEWALIVSDRAMLLSELEFKKKIKVSPIKSIKCYFNVRKQDSISIVPPFIDFFLMKMWTIKDSVFWVRKLELLDLN